MNFRKKPAEIEAVRFEKPYHRVKEVCRSIRWIKGENGSIVYGLIPTLEGDMRADLGDWIIRGIQGEFYPCKPDIFAATYEPVDEAAS